MKAVTKMGVYDKLSSQKNSLSLEHEDERDGLLQPTVQFQRSNKLNKILCISSVLFLIVIVIQGVALVHFHKELHDSLPKISPS